jgi:hypothetical protein
VAFDMTPLGESKWTPSWLFAKVNTCPSVPDAQCLRSLRRSLPKTAWCS